jgi:hypothetical protein
MTKFEKIELIAKLVLAFLIGYLVWEWLEVIDTL